MSRRRTHAATLVAALHTTAIIVAGIAVWITTREYLPVWSTPIGGMPTAGFAGIAAALIVGPGLDPLVGKAIAALNRTSQEA